MQHPSRAWLALISAAVVAGHEYQKTENQKCGACGFSNYLPIGPYDQRWMSLDGSEPECVEHLQGTKGSGYRGCQSRTESGRPCQSWISQSPHRHSRTPQRYPQRGLDDHSFCRNPDNSKTIWCYTSDSRKRWEYCKPRNADVCDETLAGTKNSGYRGCQTKTRSGRTCQKWSVQSPHKHSRTPQKSWNLGVGDHNYCRNPDSEPTIWCYTTDPDKRWEYCDPASPATTVAQASPVVRDSSYDGKKCFDQGSANRVFDLRGGEATEEKCSAKCQEQSTCIAYSGIFNSWCIGCDTTLQTDHSGSKAYKKAKPTFGPWTCHHYSSGEGDDWCKTAGTQGGFEYDYNGGKYKRCGGCWCCKRKAPTAGDLIVANTTDDNPDDPVAVCKDVCDKSGSCAGFAVTKSGTCYFRRSTICKQQNDPDSDCYTKVQLSADGPGKNQIKTDCRPGVCHKEDFVFFQISPTFEKCQESCWKAQYKGHKCEYFSFSNQTNYCLHYESCDILGTEELQCPADSYIAPVDLSTFTTCKFTIYQKEAWLDLKGSKTRQTSEGWGGSSSRAIDGNLRSDWGGRSCTHTKRHQNAWWEVELKEETPVGAVSLVNRGDCCESRLGNINVKVDGVLCASGGTNVRGGIVELACGVKGKTVTIESKKNDYLTLCEVQIKQFEYVDVSNETWFL